MKTITATELATILELHKLWLETGGEQGTRANLEGAKLYFVNLAGADLRGATLAGADLRGAYLTDADLRDANLYDAYLYDADLRGADLRGANLKAAFLEGADLTGTILDKKKEQGTTMILSEEETAAILKMRADKVNKAKIDARDIVIEVITLVTLELSNKRPSNTLTMQTEDLRQDIGSENLETISQILDLMGVKFLALTANRRAITFDYKKLNSL